MLVILRFYTPQVEGTDSPVCDCLAPKYHLHLFQPGHSFHCDFPLFHRPLAFLPTLDPTHFRPENNILSPGLSVASCSRAIVRLTSQD